jgi:hypothetical protein
MELHLIKQYFGTATFSGIYFLILLEHQFGHLVYFVDKVTIHG